MKPSAQKDCLYTIISRLLTANGNVVFEMILKPDA